MLNKILCIAAIAGLLKFSAVAQTPDPKLRFEVSTIRVSAPLTNSSVAGRILGVHGGPGSDQPDQLTIGRMSMRDLLVQAFGVKATQISGPSWLRDCFLDVTAKVPPGATKKDVSGMLQSLLVERMGLTFHREARETAGYELVVSKNGSKLTESAAEAAPPADSDPNKRSFAAQNDRNGIPQLPVGRPGLLTSVLLGVESSRQYFSGRLQTMADLIPRLEGLLEKPVLDKTGLAAKYDISFAFEPTGLPGGLPVRPPQPGATDVAPNLFIAIEQDLGLRLDEKKVLVDFVVVDKLEKTPIEN